MSNFFFGGAVSKSKISKFSKISKTSGRPKHVKFWISMFFWISVENTQIDALPIYREVDKETRAA